jgi:hypothetical protein
MGLLIQDYEVDGSEWYIGSNTGNWKLPVNAIIEWYCPDLNQVVIVMRNGWRC